MNTATTQNSQDRQPLSYSRVLKPTISKKQAVLLPCSDNTTLIEYVVGMGRLIGPANVLSASKISNKRVCIYLDSENTVENFMKTHRAITVNNNRIEVRKLVASSKRIILSNVQTCIPNAIILDALHKHRIKTTSAIH